MATAAPPQAQLSMNAHIAGACQYFSCPSRGALDRLWPSPCPFGHRARLRAAGHAIRRMRDAMILMIDNYDSFTWNVVQYLGELGAEVKVVRNDEITARRHRGARAREDRDLARALHAERGGHLARGDPALRRHAFRMLGVCLGHQCIGQVFGGRIVRARQVMHGKTSPIHHAGHGRVPRAREPVPGHALPLAGDREGVLPDCLEVTAWTVDEHGRVDEIMGVRHRELAVEGVQFHPESILTAVRARAAGEFPRRDLARPGAGGLSHGHQAGTGSRRQSHRPRPRGNARR